MDRQRVVIVGAGFAGVHAARGLHKVDVEVVLINPTDYFLYLPLLPEVTAGILDPRRVSVALRVACPAARLRLGTVEDVELTGRQVSLVDPEGNRQHVGYDRLLITAGSVNRLLPVPGVAEHAHGYRSIAEALYLRDHPAPGKRPGQTTGSHRPGIAAPPAGPALTRLRTPGARPGLGTGATVTCFTRQCCSQRPRS